MFTRIKYYLGGVFRALTRPIFQRSICPEQATTIFGCSFEKGGSHHIVRTLEELQKNPSIELIDTAMWKYLKDFCPDSISSVAGIFDEPSIPLFEYPWGSFNKKYKKKSPELSRFCGPSSEDFIRKEFVRTMGLYEKILEEGYLPNKFPNSYIGGTWLIAEDGRSKFVVMQGNHRMAILSHLGYSKIEVRSMRGVIRSVRESDLKKWPMVRKGICSETHARKIFLMFFDGQSIRAEMLDSDFS